MAQRERTNHNQHYPDFDGFSAGHVQTYKGTVIASCGFSCLEQPTNMVQLFSPRGVVFSPVGSCFDPVARPPLNPKP